MNVKRRSLAKKETTTRNVLIGTAVVGALGTLYLLTRGSSTPSTGKNLALGAYPATPTPLAASSCPVPSTSTSQFPDDDDLISYGWCQGSGLITSSTIYQDVVTAIDAGEEAAKIAGGLAAGALTLTTLLGSASLATTIAIASAVAVPVIGVVVGAIVLIGESGALSSCNIQVPSTSGGLETIDCKWYGGPAENGNPGWVPNALNWIVANPTQAAAMPVLTFMEQQSILSGSDGGGNPTYAAAYDADLLIYPNLSQYPTAYQMLKQVQLPAAAAVIGASPGLLKQLTDITTINAPALFGTIPVQASPLMVQFPALTEADMNTLQGNGDMVGAYNAIIVTAKAAAQDSANWPIDLTSFRNTYGLSTADATSLLQQYAAGHYTVPATPPIDIGGGPLTNATIASSAAGTVAKSAAVVAGAAGAALLAYKLYTGYSFLKTAQGAWIDAKKGASYLKGKLTGRKSNPISVSPYRTSATGGRIVAYRVRLFSRHEEILFNGQRAALIRHGKKVASFKPSSFQKTKIRSGRGEVLIFQDQLEG